MSFDTRRPRLLLIGTGHWANYGQDVVNPVYDDMRSAKRQGEIAEVIERLRSFAPTSIAVEYSTTQHQLLNERYRRFRAGLLELTAAEHKQLGFRLAAACDLTEVTAVDWNGGSGDLGDALAFAALHQP